MTTRPVGNGARGWSGSHRECTIPRNLKHGKSQLLQRYGTATKVNNLSSRLWQKYGAIRWDLQCGHQDCQSIGGKVLREV